MNFEHIKIITGLIIAKVEILKIKADGLTWNCHIDKEVKLQLEAALKAIDKNIECLEREYELDRIMKVR